MKFGRYSDLISNGAAAPAVGLLQEPALDIMCVYYIRRTKMYSFTFLLTKRMELSKKNELMGAFHFKEGSRTHQYFLISLQMSNNVCK